MSDSTAAERVAKGAAFLDERQPGWRDHIEIMRLDMRSGCDCVLGQLDDRKTEAGWGLTLDRFDLTRATSAALGFDLPEWRMQSTDERAAEWDELEREWLREIQAGQS